MAVIKLKPKVVNNELGIKVIINGIVIVIVSNVNISFNETDFHRSLYVNFVTDNGKIYSERNINDIELRQYLIDKGVDISEAQSQIIGIFNQLEFGTAEERYDCLNILCGFYGHTLLPLEQQDVIRNDYTKKSEVVKQSMFDKLIKLFNI